MGRRRASPRKALPRGSWKIEEKLDKLAAEIGTGVLGQYDGAMFVTAAVEATAR